MIALSSKRRFRQMFLFLFDLASLLVAIAVWAWIIPSHLSEFAGNTLSFVLLPPLAFLLWLSAYICGLYSLAVDPQFARSLFTNWVIDLMLFSAYFLIVSVPDVTLSGYITWVLVYALSRAMTRVALNFFAPRMGSNTPLCFLVDHPTVGEIIDEFTQSPQLGFAPAFVLSSNGGQSARGKAQVVHEEAEAFSRIKENRIGIAVINGDGKRGALYEKLLQDRDNSVKFYSLTKFYEFAMKRIPLDIITKGWLLENIKSDTHPGFDSFKRTVDIVVSTLIFLASLPLWPLICLAIKLEGAGPILFRQDRLGKNRQVFTILKFRTMRVNGNNHAPTEKKDARVTVVGDFLRRSRLDEIPQVINVLKGEMSFIGPRPERPELAEKLAGVVPFYYERNQVLPGMTGWDQVCGEYHSPSNEDTYKKLQHDLYYIKNRSIGLELQILLRTIRTVLFRQGR